MSTPTPDEITAAHDTLCRVPGFTDRTTLADVAAVLEPAALLAASLKGLLVERDVDVRAAHFMDIATLLTDLANRHGLRITTNPDPGELVAYVLVDPVLGGGWVPAVPGVSYIATDAGLAKAHSDIVGSYRAAAVHLLPEGGKQGKSTTIQVGTVCINDRRAEGGKA